MPGESWVAIEGFNKYLVSDMGHVQNESTGRLLACTENNYGDLRVALYDAEGNRHTLLVRNLVASYWVEGEDDIFNSVIQLNGNKADCRASNLAWRPRWFAWKFTHQFRDLFPGEYRYQPIRNIATGSVYANTLQCVAMEGVLAEDVWNSIRTAQRIFPTGSYYEIIR